MRDERIEKVKKILNAPSLDEANVQHLITLIRKLIELFPPAVRQSYALLKFYCDWTLHNEINQSVEGARIIEELNSIIAKHMQQPDNSQISTELSSALSFKTVREQITQLLSINSLSPDQYNLNDERWRQILAQLLEIISQIPLKIDGSRSALSSILKRIVQEPIRGNDIVEKLSVVKIPKKFVSARNREVELVFCLDIVMSNTTHIITPIILL